MNSVYEKEVAWLLKEKYHGEVNPLFINDCERLASGEPLAFVIGSQPFLNTTIYLESKPLIPRAETEYWVSQFISSVKERNPNENLDILDLCSGSGCIGVAVAANLEKSQVDFVEFDSDHTGTIEKNIAKNCPVASKHEIYIGDLFSAVPPGKTYNYILSNPPYIDQALNRVDSSVTTFEPELALYGGQLGLEIIDKIIIKAPIYLKTGGELWLEHEPEQTEVIKELANRHFVTNTHRDQYNLNRWTRLVLQ